MKHKRLKFSTLLLLGLGFTGLQAQTVFVRQTSGTQNAYLLSNIEKLSFPSGQITVSLTTGNPDTYSLSNVRYLNFQDLTTGITSEKTQEGTIQIFPNPVAEVLNIQVSQSLCQSYFIEILSIDGRQVYKETVNQQNNVYQINVAKLSQGLYLCKINNGKTTEITKFFKQ